MEQHVGVERNLKWLVSGDMSYPALPTISPDEIDSYLAEVAHQQPSPTLSEVRHYFV